MKTPTIREVRALIAELRGIAKRSYTFGESLQVARVQAARLRRWARAEQPDMNLIWLVRQRAVPVSFVASYKLGEQSGLTTDQVTGRLEMFINSGEPGVRQRFSLLHEFKHVLDFADAPTLHQRLGSGNIRRRSIQIELIANEFAAHVLMPTALVKHEWFAWQNLDTVAALFNVSAEAMRTRLEKLGIIGEPKPAPRAYFRAVGAAPDELPVAA